MCLLAVPSLLAGKGRSQYATQCVSCLHAGYRFHQRIVARGWRAARRVRAAGAIAHSSRRRGSAAWPADAVWSDADSPPGGDEGVGAGAIRDLRRAPRLRSTKPTPIQGPEEAR